MGQETNVLKVFFLSIYNVFHFRPFDFSALKLSPLLNLILQPIPLLRSIQKVCFLPSVLKIMFSLIFYFYSVAVVQAAAIVQVFIYSHLGNSFDSHLRGVLCSSSFFSNYKSRCWKRPHWLTVACQVTSAAPSSSFVKSYLGILV